MWRNYLTVGIRTLLHNRAFTMINILGLAVGMAACILLLLFVRYEMSFDAWLPGHGRAYQIQTVSNDPENGRVGLYAPAFFEQEKCSKKSSTTIPHAKKNSTKTDFVVHHHPSLILWLIF